MPRVQTIKKARKNYPNEGILKGTTYYRWKIRTGRSGTTHRSRTYPRASQLTGSDKKSRLYAAQESVEDAVNAIKAGEKAKLIEDLESLVGILEFGVDEADEVRQEYEDAGMSCEGGLSEKFDEMSSSCEDVRQSFEEAKDAVEELIEELKSDSTTVEDALSEAQSACENINVEIEV